MARIGRSVRVTGLVQGVFFRAWTREQAERLGVSGWVRNCLDGAVEAHLAGEEAAVEQMIDLLRTGPPHARVDRLDVDEASPEESQGFQIRH